MLNMPVSQLLVSRVRANVNRVVQTKSLLLINERGTNSTNLDEVCIQFLPTVFEITAFQVTRFVT